MSCPDVLIIGGGVAGLATGSYLQMNGFKTCICEMGDMCGGVSVSWKRKGYVFDGATNWLPGSSPSLNMHRILAELIDFSRLPVADFDEFMQITTRGGTLFRVFTDAERLREEMVRISPEDAPRIKLFTDAVGRVARLPLPLERSPEICSVPELIGTLLGNIPLALFFARWHRLSIKQFTAKFKSRELAEAFSLIFPRHEFFSVLSVIWSLGWMNMKSAGYPLGGSQRFVRLLEERYRSLGGEIRFGSRVTGIEIRDNAACGVRLASGEIQAARNVVSTADGHDTLFAMLGGKYQTPALARTYHHGRLFPGMVQVSFGVNRCFDGEPHKMVLPFVSSPTFGTDTGIPYVLLRICNNDPGFAPSGKASLVAHVRTHDPRYWIELRERDMTRYREEKQRCAEAVLETLDNRFPGLRSLVEVTDIATPATYVRYTNVWNGSYQGWAPTPAVIGRSMKKTLPGLRNFYMAGQWVEPPGGLPRVILSGRNVTQIICKDARKPFHVPTT